MPDTLKADERSTGKVPFSTGVMESDVVASCDRFSDSPRIVTDVDKGAADRVAVSVNVLVPVVAAGSKLALTPCGRPETESRTLPSKLPLGRTSTLLVLDMPCDTEIFAGAENE